jgi:dienelactone hydrolase
MPTVIDEKSVRLPAGEVELEGNLSVPENAMGIVVFAHGSGSSRFSRRNRRVAETLRERGMGTLLFDLLTAEEERVDEQTAELRFDVALLAARLAHAAAWVTGSEDTAGLPIGYFGASTGAAAALVAAAAAPQNICAIVSRGGRPDLAGPELRRVQQPVLLIVGGADTGVIDLNRQAYAQLPGEKHLEIVPGATHLFEQPGAIETVARLAADWFEDWMHGYCKWESAK